MKEIFLGDGNHQVSLIMKGGVVGIQIVKSDVKGPVGSKIGVSDLREGSDNDCVIWLKKLDSARVLQDNLNVVVATLSGYQDCFEQIGRLRDLSDKSSKPVQEKCEESNKMFYSDECHYLTYSDKTVCNKCGKLHNKVFENWWFMMADRDRFHDSH